MRLIYLFLGFLLLIMLLNIFALFYNSDFKGYKDKYTHTRALCEGNTCRDYKITCEGNNTLEVIPVTGFITFDEDWKDTREEKELCLS